MGNTVSIQCINPECGLTFPLRYRSKNVERRGMYCSRKCYGRFTPKMNEVYIEWLKRMPVYESLSPRQFMAVLLLELNKIHGTWTRRASVLRISRLSYMNWNNKLRVEMDAVGEVVLEARGDNEKAVELLLKGGVQ